MHLIKLVVPCTQLRLTTPTDVNAATMLMSVGIMLNFPAYKGVFFYNIKENIYILFRADASSQNLPPSKKWKTDFRPYLPAQLPLHKYTGNNLYIMFYIFVYTHVSIDKDIKPNSIGFDQSAVVCPVLHFIVFGKPVKSHNFYSEENTSVFNSK